MWDAAWLLPRGDSSQGFTPEHVYTYLLIVNLPESTLMVVVDTHHGPQNTVRAEMATGIVRLRGKPLSRCNERSFRAMVPKLHRHHASCVAPPQSLAIGDCQDQHVPVRHSCFEGKSSLALTDTQRGLATEADRRMEQGPHMILPPGRASQFTAACLQFPSLCERP